jgi:hypothetical protein
MKKRRSELPSADQLVDVRPTSRSKDLTTRQLRPRSSLQRVIDLREPSLNPQLSRELNLTRRELDEVT